MIRVYSSLQPKKPFDVDGGGRVESERERSKVIKGCLNEKALRIQVSVLRYEAIKRPN